MARFLLKTGMWVLSLLVVVVFCDKAWAKYEITGAQSSVQPSVIPQKGPAQDLSIQWDKPTTDAGDSLIAYVYKWNNSVTSLNDTQLSGTTKDGEVLGTVDPPFLTKAKDFFANDDYNIQWYVHIKTVYFSLTEGEKLSADVVVGPFNFDNVAPTGTVTLDTAVAGQTATTSTVNPVTLKLTSTGDVAKVYLSNSTTRPATGVNFQATLTHQVTEGVGQKTVYAWFEDQAGNMTASSVQLSFQLIAGKSMDPAGNLTLATGATQSFTILGKGTGEVFDWAFVTPSPADAASFSGGATGVASVTVQGDKVGTFKVQATSTTDAAVYTSGTVTVVAGYAKGDADGSGTIDATDALYILHYVAGNIPLDQLKGNCDVDNSGGIDATDALYVLHYVAGNISSFD